MPLFSSLEFKAMDSLFRLRGKLPLSEKIVIVAIDDASFSALDIPWPFPREYHARLIDNLSKAGARQIVFDVEFTENAVPSAASLLANSALESGRTIFAGKVLQARTPREPSQKLTPISALIGLGLPWGTVNMTADSDGTIRKYSPFEWFDDNPVYSIGIATLANWRVHQSNWDSHVQMDHHTLKVGGKADTIGRKPKVFVELSRPNGNVSPDILCEVLDDSSFACLAIRELNWMNFMSFWLRTFLKTR